nr:BV-like protein [Cotesia vestalis bracovirus]
MLGNTETVLFIASFIIASGQGQEVQVYSEDLDSLWPAILVFNHEPMGPRNNSRNWPTIFENDVRKIHNFFIRHYTERKIFVLFL